VVERRHASTSVLATFVEPAHVNLHVFETPHSTHVPCTAFQFPSSMLGAIILIDEMCFPGRCGPIVPVHRQADAQIRQNCRGAQVSLSLSPLHTQHGSLDSHTTPSSSGVSNAAFLRHADSRSRSHACRFYELATRSGLPPEQQDSEWDGQSGEESSAINVGDSDRQVIPVE